MRGSLGYLNIIEIELSSGDEVHTVPFLLHIAPSSVHVKKIPMKAISCIIHADSELLHMWAKGHPSLLKAELINFNQKLNSY